MTSAEHVRVPLQPLLNDAVVVLRAPMQAWSGKDGAIRGDRSSPTAPHAGAPFHGVFLSDVRLVARLDATVGEDLGEHLSTSSSRADEATFVGLLRQLDDRGADPGVRYERTRAVGPDAVTECLVIRSRLATPVETVVRFTVLPDATTMDRLKAGLGADSVPTASITGSTASWGSGSVRTTLSADGAAITERDGLLDVCWTLTVPARSEATVALTVTATDDRAVVGAATGPVPWSIPTVSSPDSRLAAWVQTALGDLDALRMSLTDDPDRTFLAAGAPWFFTLFGRDSLWAARMMLPLGTHLAGDTLAILARLQGTESIAASAEQPGKIMHELRRESLTIPGEGVVLPPLYFGTVDATALWVCLLHDAWRWGLADDEVRALLPHLVAALEWMRDFGDSDGDGLLEYVDETGTGLSNQGWKDSGDSVQWRDGTLAEGPIALCEVQAYAFEAAIHGADLLDHFGFADGDPWREWARRLKDRFDESFWIDDPDGAYPAIALDAAKRPVDTVTSNLGHLLGTGLLDSRQAALVARRLVSPELDSGYGLRTMSTDSAGYWPLSYHGGSVWTHDTAIAIQGLARQGHAREAQILADGLLAAAAGFDYRMPELHSGDIALDFSSPVPYPAACRPQAWSAAAAVVVLASGLGLQPDAPDAVLGVAAPASGLAPITVAGLSFAERPFTISVDAGGEVTGASGAPIEVR